MKEDPIPTIRAGAAWLKRVVCSRQVWIRAAVCGLGAVALSGIGLLGAVTSRRACEAKARAMITGTLSSTGLTPTWAAESTLHPVPFPGELLNDEVYAREAQSVFRPEVAYRADDGTQELQRDRPADAWGYTKPEVALPFIVRVHYGFGHSTPHKYPSGVWGRSGIYAEGVLTCGCAFGLAMSVHDWVVGAMFD